MSAQNSPYYITENSLPDSPTTDHASDGIVLNSCWDASHRAELPRLEGKRRLLLIYIHRFLREVHDLLKASLASTHIIFTKIYPRYKAREPIQVACDDINRRLSPHMAPDLDVILLGHSIGGLIAAETNNFVVLVTFDAPFLGLHSRIIPTGVGRLFGRKAKNETKRTSQSTTQPLIANDDPTSDPALANDVERTQRTGWDAARHFIAQHSGHLSRSVLQYVFSHYDHVGCMGDYFGLLRRHDRLCHWAKVHEFGRPPRFVNYYTTTCRSNEAASDDVHRGNEFCDNKQPGCLKMTPMHDCRIGD
ncbi:hypothetical protein COH21_012642 [Aspergillus flavus]|nr:hypothetical protein COH21_012642 [Aspergillus flavus]